MPAHFMCRHRKWPHGNRLLTAFLSRHQQVCRHIFSTAPFCVVCSVSAIKCCLWCLCHADRQHILDLCHIACAVCAICVVCIWFYGKNIICIIYASTFWICVCMICVVCAFCADTCWKYTGTCYVPLQKWPHEHWIGFNQSCYPFCPICDFFLYVQCSKYCSTVVSST